MLVILNPFDLTKREYFRVMSALQKRSLGITFWGGTCIIVVLSLYLGFLFFQGRGGSALFKLILPWDILLILWIEFVVYGNPLIFTLSKANRHQYQKYEYSFDNEYFMENRSDGGSSRAPISKFIRCEKILDYYFLQENKVSGHMFPKSAFKSTDDLDKFEKQFIRRQNISDTCAI